MKQIKAFIRPECLDEVEDALQLIEGLPGLAITRVAGYGRGKSGVRELQEKVELQTVVHDDLVEMVISTIQKSAHTGNMGDGKIFIANIEDALRIRTGERGESAI
ncbi:MAG: P-II family nitrogen regulator [Candidatus Desantisbacteria bacterium]